MSNGCNLSLRNSRRSVQLHTAILQPPACCVCVRVSVHPGRLVQFFALYVTIAVHCPLVWKGSGSPIITFMENCVCQSFHFWPPPDNLMFARNGVVRNEEKSHFSLTIKYNVCNKLYRIDVFEHARKNSRGPGACRRYRYKWSVCNECSYQNSGMPCIWVRRSTFAVLPLGPRLVPQPSLYHTNMVYCASL